MQIDYQTKGLNPDLWKELDDLTRGKSDKEYILVAEHTPDILVKLGMKDLPIYMPCAKIKMGLLSGDSYNHGHRDEVGKANLVKALQHIGDPLAINHPEKGAFGAYLPDKASTGRPMYVFFREDAEARFNVLVSVYGRIPFENETFIYADDTQLRQKQRLDDFAMQRFKMKLIDEIYKGRIHTKSSIKRMPLKSSL